MAMQSPYELLVAIDQRCRSLSSALPSQEENVESWSGIGFRVGQHYFVAPMDEVAEVLHEPRYTQLPGVKSWVRGVSNVRGRLLPVIDLGEFLAAPATQSPGDRRVLVIEHDEVFAGIVVDAVLGMQHFEPDSFADQFGGVDQQLQAYVHGQFQREHRWLVFSPFALAVSDDFMSVTLN